MSNINFNEQLTRLRKQRGLFVGMDAIREKCGFGEDKIREAFNRLPVRHKQLDGGGFGNRIEGSNMHIPSLLALFIHPL
ncbi:MAG: hypothetical protein LBN30_06110 [Oscillospiraceae bacterium]|jgi:hypothetical protein|nr:hypothetical protein [Oscillospiraceae bacterium]